MEDLNAADPGTLAAAVHPPVRLADWPAEIGHEKPKSSRDLINM